MRYVRDQREEESKGEGVEICESKRECVEGMCKRECVEGESKRVCMRDVRLRESV